MLTNMNRSRHYSPKLHGRHLVQSLLQYPTNHLHQSRFHHQWYPDEIKLEKVISKDSSLIRELQSLNHRLNFVNSMNRVDAILIENHQLFGGADNRGDDHISFF